MNGHQLHRLGFFPLIHVGKQRGVVKIIAQRHLFPRFSGKVVNCLLQLRQIVEPLLFPTDPEHILIAALVQDACQQVCQIHAVVNRPVLFNQPHILPGPAAAEQFCVQTGFQSFVETALVQLRKLLQGSDSGAAHAPPRLIHRAQKADVVTAVNHAKIAQYVFDLLALVEFHAGIENVRNLISNQGFLHRPGNIVCPVQHAHGRIGHSSVMERPHICRDPVRFQLAGLSVEIQGLFSVRANRSQLLFQAIAVFVDEGIGGRKHLWNGTIVGIQADGFGLGMAAFKFQNEIHIRSPPGVNRLIRIAHHEQIPVVAGKDFRQRVLVFVNILKLVHHDIFQPPLPLLPHRLITLQNIQRKVHQIIKIQPVAFALFIEITIEHLVFQGISRVRQAAQLLRIANQRLDIAPAAFAPADMVHRFLDGQLPAGNTQILEHPPQNGLLVLLVQHNESGRILHHMAVLFQESHAETMKSRNPAQILIRQLAADAFFHLRGGLVGKGHAQNVGGGDPKHFHQIQIPGRQGFGLAGTGPGHHPDIALCRDGRFLLLGIQFFQICHGSAPPF